MSVPSFFLRTAKSIRLLSAEKLTIRESIRKVVRKQENDRLTFTMDEQDFFERANAITLTPSEKAVIREALLDTMHQETRASWWLLPCKSFSSVTAAFLIVMISGASVSFAAEDTMPGDLLYSVKVHVNEEVKSRLTFNPMAKVEWEAFRVERRLREAETLAAQSKLNAKTAAMIAKNIRMNIATVQASTNAMMEMNAEMAASVGIDMEATLAAYAGLLTRLSANENRNVFSELIKTIDDARMDIEENNIAATLKANPSVLIAALHVRMGERKADGQPSLTKEATAPMAMMARMPYDKTEDTSMEEEIRAARIKLRSMKELKLLKAHHEVVTSFSSQGDTKTSEVLQIKASKKEIVPTSSSVAADASLSKTEEKDDKEDKNFSTNVRLRMTEKKMKNIETTISERHKKLRDEVVTPSEARVRDAKNLIDMAKVKMKEGDVNAALDASNKALRHADDIDKELKNALKGR